MDLGPTSGPDPSHGEVPIRNRSPILVVIECMSRERAENRTVPRPPSQLAHVQSRQHVIHAPHHGSGVQIISSVVGSGNVFEGRVVMGDQVCAAGVIRELHPAWSLSQLATRTCSHGT